MNLVLAGFCAITDAEISFLIPYFSEITTNYNYAQELDRKFCISEFILFDPDNFRKINVRVPSIRRSIGDDGIIAYQLSEDYIQVGTLNHITDALIREDISKLSSFFQIEAYSLLGKLDDVRLAYESSSRLFEKEAHRDRWIDSCVKSNFKLLLRGPDLPIKNKDVNSELENAIGLLSEQLSAEYWYETWSKCWIKTGGDSRLIELALWWLEKYIDEKSEASKLIVDILSTEVQPEAVRSHAYHWLMASHLESQSWPSIWMLYARSRQITNELFDRGVFYLDYCIKSQIKDNTVNNKTLEDWSKIWNYAWNSARHTQHLATLAKKVHDASRGNKIIIENVFLPIIKRDNPSLIRVIESDLVEWLDDRLLSYEKTPEFLLLLLKIEYHSSLINRCVIDWLKNERQSHNWPIVWRMLEKKVPSHMHSGIARDWLASKKNQKEIIWPLVLGEVIKSNVASRDDYRNAENWLEKNRPKSVSFEYKFLKEAISGKVDRLE